MDGLWRCLNAVCKIVYEIEMESCDGSMVERSVLNLKVLGSNLFTKLLIVIPVCTLMWSKSRWHSLETWRSKNCQPPIIILKIIFLLKKNIITKYNWQNFLLKTLFLNSILKMLSNVIYFEVIHFSVITLIIFPPFIS